MTELEICQIQFRICYLLYTLGGYPKLRSLLKLLKIVEVWTSAGERSNIGVQNFTANFFMEEEHHEIAVEVLERLLERRATTTTSDLLLNSIH